MHEKLAKDLVFCFGKGFCLDGQVIEVTRGKERERGCRLVIYDTAEYVKDEILPMIKE